MSSWGSWLKAQTSAIADGVRDFTDQLNEDTAEVRQEVGTKIQTANEKLAEVSKVVTDSTALNEVSKVVGDLSSTGATRLSEKVEQLSFDDMMKSVEGALVQAERGTSQLLSRGVRCVRRRDPACQRFPRLACHAVLAPLTTSPPPRPRRALLPDTGLGELVLSLPSRPGSEVAAGR